MLYESIGDPLGDDRVSGRVGVKIERGQKERSGGILSPEHGGEIHEGVAAFAAEGVHVTKHEQVVLDPCPHNLGHRIFEQAVTSRVRTGVDEIRLNVGSAGDVVAARPGLTL